MANSKTILPITAYSSNTTQPVTGDKFKGGGFYSQANGFHTVQWNLYNFVGNIGIQATLEINPSERDWFLVTLGNEVAFMDTTGRVATYTASTFQYTSSTNGVYASNFSGNYVWIRAYITNWTAGNVNSIILSY